MCSKIISDCYQDLYSNAAKIPMKWNRYQKKL